LGVNEGTSPFWIHTGKELETPHDVKNLSWVQDLPEGNHVDFEFSTGKYIHTVRRVGKMAKLISSEKQDTDIGWTLDDDIDEFCMETPEIKVEVFEESKFLPPATASPESFIKTFSLNGGINKKKTLKVVLASGTKEQSSGKKDLESKRKQLKSLSEQPRKGKVLQSGASPQRGPPPSSGHSPSRPQDIVVKMVLMSRKQEKLYNGITHTRKFQQCLRNGTNEEKSQLRKSLLAFVTSPAPLTGNPVQDFLGLHCQPRTAQSSTLTSSSSLRPL